MEKKTLTIICVVIIAVVIVAVAAFILTQNGNKDSGGGEDTPDYTPVTISTYVDYNGNKTNITFNKMPDRIVAGCCTALNALLYFGLGDKIIGAYYIEEDVWDEVADEWEKVKARIGDDHVLFGNIQKDVLTSWEPDLVIGWVSWTDGDKKLGSNENYWNPLGCNVMSFNTMVDDSDVEGMKTDYNNLGKIFQMEAKTTTYLNSLLKKVQSVQGVLKDEDVTVAVYDGLGASDAKDISDFWFYKPSSTFIGYMLQYMGLDVFCDANASKMQKSVLYDRVDEIDIMFFVCYGQATYDKTLAIWNSDDILKRCPAMINGKIQAMKLSVAYGADPSVIDVIDYLYELFTGEDPTQYEYKENDTSGTKVEFKYDPSIRLAIFGNANGDDYIDENDLYVLKAIVRGERSIDPVINAFADTDGNGYVNGSDVALLQKLVNKEECKLYYWANTYQIECLNYPVEGKIASHHVYPLDACIILGLYDDVVGMTNQGFNNAIGKDPNRYPGTGTTLLNIGTPEEDPEKLLASGADILISPASSKDYTKVVDAYKAAGKDIQIIRLCMSQYYPTCPDLYGSILMLGVMFQKEAEAEEFVAFADELVAYVNDRQLDLGELTFISGYDVTETGIELDSSLTDGRAMGDVYTLMKLPLISVNVVTDTNYCPDITMEEVLKINPDVIFVITFHTYAWSVEEHQAEINELAEYFVGTEAYETGNIYSVNYYNIANYGGIPQLALIASYIWPESFSEEIGWEYLQKYYSNWTLYPNPDVTKMGNAFPYAWEKP